MLHNVFFPHCILSLVQVLFASRRALRASVEERMHNRHVLHRSVLTTAVATQAAARCRAVPQCNSAPLVAICYTRKLSLHAANLLPSIEKQLLHLARSNLYYDHDQIFLEKRHLYLLIIYLYSYLYCTEIINVLSALQLNKHGNI